MLKISNGHPDWKAYVDFVNSVVVDGLVESTAVSLSYLSDQICPNVIAKTEKSPMLEIELSLTADIVVFKPSITRSSNKDGLRDLVGSWISDFFKMGTIFKRCDRDGTYVKEISGNMMVKALIAKLSTNLTYWEQKLSDFKGTYEEFSYIWTTDLKTMFEAFLEDATDVVTVPGTEEGEEIDISCGIRGRQLNLQKFDVEIQKYKEVQSKVAALRTPTNVGWLRYVVVISMRTSFDHLKDLQFQPYPLTILDLPPPTLPFQDQF